MGKKLTKEVFVERARLAHGDKYDYSKVEYKGVDTAVVILCPEHGPFTQTPYHHMRGGNCPKCAAEIRKKTCMDKYGTPYAVAADSTKKKIRRTFVERYGAENPMQNADVKKKMEETNLKRYGSKCVFGSSEIQKKKNETIRERYGVDAPLKNSDIMEKVKATNLERYGVENPMQNADVRLKGRRTNMERYGAENPFASKEIQEKIKGVNLERYGYEHPFSNSEVRKRYEETMKKNGSYSKSNAEENVYAMLLTRFSEEDVVRQYKSDEYPFLCDFYIRSRRLYIELNAMWTHGGHWYDACDSFDQSVLGKWKKHADVSPYYQNAIYNWTDRDVLKRNTARAHDLNYVVFWDTKLWDAMLWFELGCPDGKDWEQVYSWM